MAGAAPWQAAAAGAAAALVLAVFTSRLLSLPSSLRRRGGLAQVALDALKAAPGVRGVVARETGKLEARLRAALPPRAAGCPPLFDLPPAGVRADEVMRLLTAAQAGDALTPGHIGAARRAGTRPPASRVSGALYLPPSSTGDHVKLLTDAGAAYAHTNPMHAATFPSTAGLERDVVAMAASLLGGPPAGEGVDPIRGSITSGGTESILTAVLAAREHAARSRGLVSGGVVVAGASAHAAFAKACHYFGLRLVTVPVDAATGRVTGAAVRAALRRHRRSAVLAVASAVSFPHGALDDVPGIAAAAAAAGVPCHVDACLGGFVLPFAAAAGRPPPHAWHFAVPGVTSMSVDTHKFGLAPKGSSVVLFRGRALRAASFAACADWPGGLYISPGLAGSRSGSAIAATWAALVHQGRQGLANHAARAVAQAAAFEVGLQAIPELEIVGVPAASVVAFGVAREHKGSVDIYHISDLLSTPKFGGWHLNALQHPPALHMCFTAQHAPVGGSGGGAAEALLADLKAAVAAARAAPGAAVAGGSAPIYGLAGATPDRGLVRDFLETYQDVLLTG